MAALALTWSRPASLRAGHVVPMVVAGLLAGLLPPLLGAIVVFATIVLVVGVARPRLPLYLLGLGAPLASVREIRVGGIGVSPTEGLVALALFSYALSVLSDRGANGRFSRWGVPIALFVAIALLSTTWAGDRLAAAKELLRWVELGAAFGLAVALIHEARHARVLITVLLLGGLAEGLLGIGQFLLRIGPPSFEVGRFLRAYGSFGQPNPYGGYLLMVLPIALAVAWTFLPGRIATALLTDRLTLTAASLRPLAWPLLALFVLAVTAAGIGASLSRGAWMGLAVGLEVMLTARGRRTWPAVVLGVFVVSMVALLGAFEILPAAAAARLEQVVGYFGVFDVRTVVLTSENWAIVERMAHWQAAWEMWLDHPLLGIGAGQYPVLYKDYAASAWPDALGHAHNIYLNIAAELGTLGLIAYTLMVGSWIVLAVRLARRARTPLTRAVGLGALGAVAATATHNLFDNLYVAGMNVHVGLLLGLAAAAVGLDEAARLPAGESRPA